MASSPRCAVGEGKRPALEVADIFREHGERYRREHALSAEQERVMRAIERCRTAALGGHLERCTRCGYESPSYNSCRNRHCPKCQALSQAKWVEQRMARILPVRYFHVVFTLPGELHALALRNRRRVFGLLFACVSQTLLEFGKDEAWLGGTIGFTAVLHTWTRDLRFHPHLHCIVTGGGLSPAEDRWIEPKHRRFLFPVRAMAQVFRGKFLDALRGTYEAGALDLGGTCKDLQQPAAFGRWLNRLYRKPWVVYAKRPFGGPAQVYRYLGHYTHRVGISNHRLQAMDEHGVRFATRNGNVVTLDPLEFIRRFLLHVLPRGFVKIRHYGLLASTNGNRKLERARELLPPPAAASPGADLTTTPTAAETSGERNGPDDERCPLCKLGLLVRVRFAPVPSRAPP
jgi:predicted Zn-ribbon and HTH transcriptional regulator